MTDRIPPTDGVMAHEIFLKRFFRGAPVSREVIVITASKGVMKGHLSETPSFMQLPHSTNQQELWTVMLEGNLEKGDCGSWVIDATNGSIYAHVIGASRGSGFAYAVPLWQISNEIDRQFEGTWKLAKAKNLFREKSQLKPLLGPNHGGHSSDTGQIRRPIPKTPHVRGALRLPIDARPSTMSFASQQAIYQLTIQDFLESLSKSCVLGTRGSSLEVMSPFIPISVLESEISKPYKLEALLKAAFLTDQIPVNMRRIRLHCLRIFRILLKIGHRSEIQLFSRETTKVDQDLPFLLAYSSFPCDAEDASFFNLFDREQ